MFPREARVPEDQGSASATGNIYLFHWYQRGEDGKCSSSGQMAPRREGRVWGGARFMDAEPRRQAGMVKQKDGGRGGLVRFQKQALLFSLTFHLVFSACGISLPAGQGRRCEGFPAAVQPGQELLGCPQLCMP